MKRVVSLALLAAACSSNPVTTPAADSGTPPPQDSGIVTVDARPPTPDATPEAGPFTGLTGDALLCPGVLEHPGARNVMGTFVVTFNGTEIGPWSIAFTRSKDPFDGQPTLIGCMPDANGDLLPEGTFTLSMFTGQTRLPITSDLPLGNQAGGTPFNQPNYTGSMLYGGDALSFTGGGESGCVIGGYDPAAGSLAGSCDDQTRLGPIAIRFDVTF